MTHSMQSTPPDVERLRAAIVTSVHEHWLFYFIEGLVLIVLGVLAVIVPPLASLAVAIFVGWLFLVGGGFGLATTLMSRHAPGFWWALLSAVLAIVVGALLVWWPAGGVLSLTLLLTAFFIVDGIASILFAIEHQRHGDKGWGWLLASGLVDLLLAGLIFLGLPGTAAWAIGLIVGIDLIFGGSALVMVALKARTARQ